jgi:hypothetical protein
MPVTYYVVGERLPIGWFAPQRIRDLFRMRRLVAALGLQAFDEVRFFHDEAYRDQVVTDTAEHLLRQRLVALLRSRAEHLTASAQSTSEGVQQWAS